MLRTNLLIIFGMSKKNIRANSYIFKCKTTLKFHVISVRKTWETIIMLGNLNYSFTRSLFDTHLGLFCNSNPDLLILASQGLKLRSVCSLRYINFPSHVWFKKKIFYSSWLKSFVGISPLVRVLREEFPRK